MINPDIKTLFDLRVIPADGKQLYTDAVTNSSLMLSDYQTIKDLISTTENRDNLHLNALFILMFNNLAQGSLCLGLDLQNLNAKLKGVTVELEFDQAILDNCLGTIDKSGLLSKENTPGIPFILDDDKLYFQRFYSAEKRVQSILTRMMHKTRIPESVAPAKGGVHQTHPELHQAITDVITSMKQYKLNPLQLLAVCCGLTKNFTVISGGPGTGKTSTATALLRSMVRLGTDPRKIKLTAPTGRAAQRLSESVKDGLQGVDLSKEDSALLDSVEGTTLHSLLKYNPRTGGFGFGPKNPIDADVVLIDEVSMVDVFMMGSLLDALKPEARVIFLGDKDQLPSVDEGAVLESLVPGGYEPVYSKELLDLFQSFRPALRDGNQASELPNLASSTPTDNPDPRTDRIVILQESHRSVPEILDFAQGVNTSKVGQFNKILKHSPTFENVKQWQSYLETWLQRKYQGYADHIKEFESCSEDNINDVLVKVFSVTEASRILTLVRGGLQGKNWINKKLNAFLKPQLDPQGSENVFSGAPIIITNNSPSSNLYNGDVGVILKREGEYRAWFGTSNQSFRLVRNQDPTPINFRSLSLNTLPGWEPACAITVHKSQGSEYDHVLLILPADENHRLLSRQIVYTGITRAKKSAEICGSLPALERAVQNRMQRESGLGFVI